MDARSKPVRDVLTTAEIGSWLEACEQASWPGSVPRVVPSEWWRAFVLFSYNTGLRLGTVMQLEWGMLDEDGWLSVPAELLKGDRGARFYCNRFAREALESTRPWKYPTLFPTIGEWPAGKYMLLKQSRKLLQMADVHRHGVGPYCLRRALLAWLVDQDSLLAQVVAGYAVPNHFDPGKLWERASELLELVPQPASPEAASSRRPA